MATAKRRADIQDSTTRAAERALGAAGESDHLPAAEYRALLDGYRRLLSRFEKVMVISDSYAVELKKITEQLEQVRSLALPICMFCKKVRVDDTYWQQIDTYFARHIDIAFSHGICPDCLKEKYGEMVDPGEARERFAREVRDIVRPAEQKGVPEADGALKAAEALLAAPGEDGEAIRAGLSRLADRYRRLLRRMGKILLISDGYQARLMDMNTRLELMARTDVLTGLANRANAVERLEAERSRAERHGTVFSLLIADVDNFKALNDAHGHEAGDLVLRAVAVAMRSALRKEDTCARWGGEEFLVLLPETAPAAAEILARKLLDAVRTTSVRYGEAVLRCTVSAGIAAFRPGRTVDETLRVADAALYAAKRAGKDRVAAEAMREWKHKGT